MIRAGDPSPWGEIDVVEKLAEDVFFVSTSGHGGLMVHKNQMQNLSDYVKEQGLKSGDYFGFEEDCDWALVAFELKLMPQNLNHIKEVIVNWHPAYAKSNKELLASLDPELREKLKN